MTVPASLLRLWLAHCWQVHWQKPTNLIVIKHCMVWLWEVGVKTQCVLKCKSVDHKHVWMQRESRQKGMVEGVHTNKAMAVSLLNDCVVVGDTVGMVVVTVCCGMDVECKRMLGYTQNTDCTKVV